MDEQRERQRAEIERMDAFREQEMRQRPTPEIIRKVADVVNDPAIVMTPDLIQATNDPRTVMDPSNGRLETQPFDNRFSEKALSPTRKKARKKTKTNKVMSSCLKTANQRLRTKSGKLRKGKTQADVMRLAHRLCRKQMK